MIKNELNVKENYILKNLTTFKIGGPARYFFEADSVEELIRALHIIRRYRLQFFILGGGSNVLVSDDGFDGIVLKINTKALKIFAENEQSVTINVASGECWDDVVAQSVEAGWWGIENLSHIPGSMGALAIQNVGAYGQEAGDVIQYVEVWDTETEKIKKIHREECRFSYRKSLFNSTMKGRYVILNTAIKLKKHGEPNMNYREVKNRFDCEKLPTIKEMREAIIDIRDKKLPNPDHIGNAGSFFKNVILTEKEFDRLKASVQQNLSDEAASKLVEINQKSSASEGIKISTAFLIDSCGLKGIRVGGAELYDKNSLIVVNATGNATARDVMKLAKKIRQTVYHNTGVKIPLEPELVGFSKQELEGYFMLEN